MAFNLQNGNPMVRVAAYLGMFLFAVNVSGGHFNPATSIAVFMTEKDARDRNLKYLITVIIIQVFGAYLGILFAFLLVKDYNSSIRTNDFHDYANESFALYPRPPIIRGDSSYAIYFYKMQGDTEPSIYYTRVSFQEILQTCLFTLTFLALRYDPMLAHKTNRVIKGLALAHVLLICYVMSLGAGACLNPALGLA